MKKEVESYMKKMLSENDSWAKRALVIVYNNQTNDEQKVESVLVNNGVGFTSSDGHKLSGIAKFYLERGFLTEKQINCVKKRISKYWRQIWNVSNQDKILSLIEK